MAYATIHEKVIIRTLCKAHLSSNFLDELLELEASDYEHSGCGYFLFFKHESLPQHKIACDSPTLLGKWNNIESGYLVFIGEKELMLECHSWGEVEVPRNYREQKIDISVINI